MGATSNEDMLVDPEDMQVWDRIASDDMKRTFKCLWEQHWKVLEMKPALEARAEMLQTTLKGGHALNDLDEARNKRELLEVKLFLAALAVNEKKWGEEEKKNMKKREEEKKNMKNGRRNRSFKDGVRKAQGDLRRDMKAAAAAEGEAPKLQNN